MAAPDLNEQGRPTRKTAGVTAELRVAVELLDHGFSISWPVGDMDAYDLISDSKKSLRRIQVKSITTPNKNGTYKVSFRHGTSHITTYDKSEVDYFVAVLNFPCGIAMYVIPVGEAPSTAIFFPPNRHPRFPDKWKTCALEKWRGRWDLLR